MTVDEVIEQLKRTTLVSVNGIVIAVVLHAIESLRDENARLSQAAEPEAVEPKDWPDAQGLWSRQGKIYAALTDRCEMMVRNINGPQWRNVCDSLRGNWLPCKVLVPSAKEPEAKPASSVMQEWTQQLSMMQQTVLLTAIRGPDGLPKYGCVKMLLRWYRRCVVLSAMDGKVLGDPCDSNGGSFTGPSLPEVTEDWESPMSEILSEYLRTLDAVPHHFQLHLMHAIEILGYKHPCERIRNWWHDAYRRLVRDMHLHPESEAQLDERLGDDRSGWLKHADAATTK